MLKQHTLTGWVMALSVTSLAVLADTAVAATEVQIVYVGDRNDSAWAGASQGLSEANLQGQFLGQTYQLTAVGGVDGLKDLKPAAVVAAVDAKALKNLAESLPGIAIFNVALDDDALRAACTPNVLHVIPSQSMQKDAVTQWKTKNPDANVVAAAWHPQAVKYSGEQLNQRYSRAYGKPMDDHAWAGWAAVKMLSDTVVRAQSAEPSLLLDYLKTQLRFDGQKGVDMNFRPNGQLRQPLLIVEAGKLAGEAPVKGVAASVEDLDSLGGAGDCGKQAPSRPD